MPINGLAAPGNRVKGDKLEPPPNPVLKSNQDGEGKRETDDYVTGDGKEPQKVVTSPPYD